MTRTWLCEDPPIHCHGAEGGPLAAVTRITQASARRAPHYGHHIVLDLPRRPGRHSWGPAVRLRKAAFPDEPHDALPSPRHSVLFKVLNQDCGQIVLRGKPFSACPAVIRRSYHGVSLHHNCQRTVIVAGMHIFSQHLLYIIVII